MTDEKRRLKFYRSSIGYKQIYTVLVGKGWLYPESHVTVDWIKGEGDCYIICPNLLDALMLRPEFNMVGIEK